MSLRVELCRHLTREELNLLYDAALLAIFCNVSINYSSHTLQGSIECELRRTNLERSFMEVRNQFLATSGWKQLPKFKQQIIWQHYLEVCVNEQNL
jgi:hypothetical protein